MADTVQYKKLVSTWIEKGEFRYQKGEVMLYDNITGLLILTLQSGRSYDFPDFPLWLWDRMKDSQGAGSVLWESIWDEKRTITNTSTLAKVKNFLYNRGGQKVKQKKVSVKTYSNVNFKTNKQKRQKKLKKQTRQKSQRSL